MKSLYSKNKGKVFPSPTPTSSSPSEASLAVLKTLPATILALTAVLLLEDLEVLAYLITRSLKTPVISEKYKCKLQKNPNHLHRPVFDCGCFECYTSFWIRWDSSPNRELIHQVIEAFEEHLARGEVSKKKNGRGKHRKSKHEEQEQQKPGGFPERIETPTPENEMVGEVEEAKTSLPETLDSVSADIDDTGRDYGDNRSLLRKVLVPDVMGLFASHLWNVWNPNV